MTVQVQEPINKYTGNGSVTAFTYTFLVTDASDLKVYVAGVRQLSGFTVTGVGSDAGGTVTFTVAPANGALVILQRLVELNRSTDYQEGASLATDTLDRDFDRIVLMVQDTRAASITLTGGGVLDAKNQRIINLADPIAGQDAVTKVWAETSSTSQVSLAMAQAAIATAKAGEASTSASAASTSATSAASSASAASTSASAASTSAATATTKAAEANTSAGNASTSATNAAASATAAATSAAAASGAAASATSAAGSATAASTSAANAATSETNAGVSANASAASAALAATFAPVPTGVPLDYFGSTAPAGFVFASGLTIGSASSGATERAHSDTQALFTLLWNSMANSEASVSSGRGASAAADFAANKTIALPDLRGRLTAGKDNMGGTTANRLTSGGSGVTGTTLGAAGGLETHSLTVNQNAPHTHGLNGAIQDDGGASYNISGGGRGSAVNLTGSSGTGAAHNNTQPTYVVNKIIKL